MEIIFLGTSAGIPTEKRNHSAILIIYEGNYILFDCGEGTQRQFKKLGISPLRLDKIFITHLHADHILGLAGILQTLAMNDYSKKLEIYGPKGIKNYINSLSRFFPIIKKINLSVTEIKGKTKFKFDKYEITALKLKHIIENYGYIFKEKDKVKIRREIVNLAGGPSPLFKKLKEGKVIKLGGKTIKPKDATYIVKGKKIGIILDSVKCKNIFEIAKNTDLLVIECVYGKDNLDKAKNYFHLSTLDVADIIIESNPKRVFLTHISERYKDKEEILVKEIKEEINKKNKVKKVNIYLANDLLNIVI